jgi:hypothetical protein
MALEPEERLADVLRPVADWLGEVPAQARNLAAHQLHAALESGLPLRTWFQQPSVQVRLRLHWSVRGRQVVLFLFRRDTGDRAVFDATVNSQVSALDQPLPPVPESVGDLRLALTLPRVFAGIDHQAIRLRAGPEPEDILEIRFPPDTTDLAKAIVSFRGRRLPEAKWPIGPFIGLFREIRAGLNRESDRGTEIPIPSLTQNEAGETRQILFELLKGWRQAQQKLAAHAAAADSDPADPSSDNEPLSLADGLDTLYGVTDFSANIDLGLTPDGKLATADDDETVQISIRLNVRPEEGQWAARLTLAPPDFLLTGPLVDQIREEFGRQLDRSLSRELERRRIVIDAKRARDFLTQGGDGVSLFRVKRRGTRDTELLLLSGMLDTKRILVMARGTVEFSTDGKQTIESARRFRLLFAGPENPEALEFDEEDQEWLLHVAIATKAWMRLLP